MLIEKEVIRPGTYFYRDMQTGLPRKLVATPEMVKYWHDQGNKMLSHKLPIPVPYEHDFDAHPMSPKEKLLNNAGEVAEYRMKGDALYSICNITDDDVKKKLGKGIRWTSPWFNSFVDGSGREWKNVIAHLALTTKPRIVEQAPFNSVAAALSMATEISGKDMVSSEVASGAGGFCLSRAGRLIHMKADPKQLRPRYPMAFSFWVGGVPLADEDMAPPKKKEVADEDHDEEMDKDGGGDEMDIESLMNPMQDATGDVKMEELLCDLLTALGVQMPENVGESEFKRALYEAAMSKIKELSAKGQAAGNGNAQNSAGNTTSPAGGNQGNPLIQQEQQPMYMSLEDINKISDPTMKGIALAMYNENVKLRGELEAGQKTANSLRDAKLKEESAKRQTRVQLLGKLSPKVKADLDAMVALPAMALSIGDGGVVVDPMAQTLAMLEKGLADMPRLLTVDQSALSVQAQPTDESMLSEERTNELADSLARQMGAVSERKTA